MTQQPCKKCKNNPALLSGYCEECLIKNVSHIHYREHPICRQRINDYLKDDSNLTLSKIAFWSEFDKVSLIPSDSVRAQARKMLIEERSKQP